MLSPSNNPDKVVAQVLASCYKACQNPPMQAWCTKRWCHNACFCCSLIRNNTNNEVCRIKEMGQNLALTCMAEKKMMMDATYRAVIASRCSALSSGRYMMIPTQLKTDFGSVEYAGLMSDADAEVQRCSIGDGAGIFSVSICARSCSMYAKSANAGLSRVPVHNETTSQIIASIECRCIENLARETGVKSVDSKHIIDRRKAETWNT